MDARTGLLLSSFQPQQRRFTQRRCRRRRQWMSPGKGGFAVRTLVVAVFALVSGPCFAQGYAPGDAAQDSQSRAVACYLEGEAAFNSKDYVTALVKWKDVLQLKPDSTYTRKCIERLRPRLTARDLEAYDYYLTALALRRKGWNAGCVDQCRIALYYAPGAKCIRELYDEAYRDASQDAVAIAAERERMNAAARDRARTQAILDQAAAFIAAIPSLQGASGRTSAPPVASDRQNELREINRRLEDVRRQQEQASREYQKQLDDARRRQERTSREYQKQLDDARRRQEQMSRDYQRQLDKIKEQQERNAPVQWKCRKCGMLTSVPKSKGAPSSFDCPASNFHSWSRKSY